MNTIPDDDYDEIIPYIDYEIINGECSHCGGSPEYFDPELSGCLPDKNGKYPDGYWFCPSCNSDNEALEQGNFDL